jgi:ABC-type dipeptide/oligopeptide/nickel transport system permease component
VADSQPRLLLQIGKRLAAGFVSLIFLAFVVFMIDEVAPGDAAVVKAGEKATLEQVQRIRVQMGLDRPWFIRFPEYVAKAATGDFGASYQGTQEPVSKILASALPLTLSLAGPAILVAIFMGLTLGTIAAVWRGRWPDRLVLAFSTLGVTVPNFVLAPILVLIFSLQLDALPATWESPLRAPAFFYLLLPVLVLSARPSATLVRLTRASMIDTLSQEFIKLARAKGVGPLRLVLRHGLRNAVLPVITSMGTSFGFLLTGSYIVETFFTMPGMGFQALKAIQKNDTPVLMGCVLLTGLLFIVVNLLVDILQPILDPRIREAQI